MDFQALKEEVKGSVYLAEPMAKHTTWRIGGPADCLFLPADVEDLTRGLAYAKARQLPYMILGNGSNMLVLDGGIRGLVIQIGENMARYQLAGEELQAEAGCLLAKMARDTAKMGFQGLEWAAGIPASLGGAAIMNAGAYGHFFYEVLKAVTFIDEGGKTVTDAVQDLAYGYRKTSFMGRNIVITKVLLQLQKGDAVHLNDKVEEILKTRRQNQPLDMPSAGSVFKNPANDHAGRLVEAAGLRGLCHGAAQVSPKHGNFIVNLGGARARDVLSLISEVQNIVKEKYDIILEPEVRLVGEA